MVKLSFSCRRNSTINYNMEDWSANDYKENKL